MFTNSKARKLATEMKLPAAELRGILLIKLETGDLWLAGAALTVFEITGVADVLTAGSISDRFGRRRIFIISLFPKK